MVIESDLLIFIIKLDIIILTNELITPGVPFSTETLLVMWPNLFTVWQSVVADGLIATLGSNRRAHKTLFASKYKSRTT